MDKNKLRDSREVRKLYQRRLKGRFMRVMKDDTMRERCLVPFLEYIGIQIENRGSVDVWRAVLNLGSSDKEYALKTIDAAIDAYDQALRKVHRIELRGIDADRENMMEYEVRQRIAGVAVTNWARWAKTATSEEILGQTMPAIERMVKKIFNDTPEK